MNEADFGNVLGPALTKALEEKGYQTLTAVQLAVLDPAHAAKDLRISSQTGSGKTLALGFAVRQWVEAASALGADSSGVAHPAALVVAPTRELAKQVAAELRWLFAPLRAGVTAVTGGASYRDELRALSRSPAVVVGTPGRLLDHLDRGSLDGTQTRAVVLDEADQLLDLGFRDDLHRILDFARERASTHLVSATFPPEVRALADSVQRSPIHVQGTRLGAANVDIEHVVHVIRPNDRLAAIINLLLAHADTQTLVFAKTRVDVAELTAELQSAGVSAGSLSGDMSQRDRTATLSAFKSGQLRALVATDVAARGIDVQQIGLVIHAEAPSDPDAYTHRSGRTGRAGRKGRSVVLATPATLGRVSRLLDRARAQHRIEPVPSEQSVLEAQDARALQALTSTSEAPSARHLELAERALASVDPKTLVARLLAAANQGGPAPRHVATVEARPATGFRAGRESGDARGAPRPWQKKAPAGRNDSGSARREGETWVAFNVTWGERHGADPRRLLALVCRRGGIQSQQVGAIRVGPASSTVEVAGPVADRFATAASRPDARDPRVRIQAASAGGYGGRHHPSGPRGGQRAERRQPPVLSL